MWINKEKHDDTYQRPYNLSSYVLDKVKEFNMDMDKVSTIMDKRRVVSMIGWKPPMHNFVKLDTNGACRDNNLEVIEWEFS